MIISDGKIYRHSAFKFLLLSTDKLRKLINHKKGLQNPLNSLCLPTKLKDHSRMLQRKTFEILLTGLNKGWNSVMHGHITI